MTTKDPLLRTDWQPPQWDPEYATERTKWLTGSGQSGTGRTLVFDIEGDGLLYAEGGKQRGEHVWCIGAKDVDTAEKFYWGIEQGGTWLEDGLRFLREAACLLAHNGIGFDYPYLEDRCPGWERPAKAWDTMVIAKVIWPYDSLIEPDLRLIKQGKLPGFRLKSMALEAWGCRFGSFKVDYTGPFKAAGMADLMFSEWCPAMATYMMSGDLDIPDILWKRARVKMGWLPAADGTTASPVWSEETLLDEHAVARIIHEQREDGVHFDLPKAMELSRELQNQQAVLERKLVETFGSWWQNLGTRTPTVSRSVKMVGEPDITVPRYSEKTGKRLKDYVGPPLCHFTAGEPYTDVEYVTFNPGSRDHLGMRLQAVFGWKPKKFGKDGKPSVDESTLEEIPDAVMPAETRQLILDYFVVTKTLGTLSKGKKSWIGLCAAHSEKYGTVNRIHGNMDPCGAVTRRGTHKDPNLSGTPAVRKEKVEQPDGTKREVVLRGLAGRYGYECRELFQADEGWEQTGTDAASLELIDLGHYLAPLDGGAFSARVCDPSRDAHTEHAEICGTTRADAKTTIYLFVYGGSAYKLSLDPAIKVTPDMVPALLGYRGLPQLLKGLERRFDADFVAKLDDMQKARIAHCRQVILKLEAGISGLKVLKDGDEDKDIAGVSQAAQRGWLKAIDGSRIIVRKPHAALNALLQSAGAISCKRWMRFIHEDLKAQGLRRGVDFKQLLFIHDELQFTHRPGLGPVILETAERCIKRVGVSLGLRGEYRSDGKTGRNWAETH